MSDETARQILALSERLFGQKAPFNSLCQTIADNFYPERASFTQQQPLGSEFASHIFNSYPVRARRDLGNAFSSMLRPRGKEWFSTKIKHHEDELNAESRAWLEGTAKVMRAVMYDDKTRFVRTLKETDQDFAAFGNAILTCEPNRARDSLIYRCWHPAMVAWGEDEYGFPSPIVRKDKMEAREIVRMAGEGQTPQKIVDEANDAKKQFTEHDITHVVMPAEMWERYSGKKLKQPWVSAYVLNDGAVTLRTEGIRSKRYIIPRWQTISGTQYALSPATIIALPDARMIQQLSMILLEAGEKAIDPPLLGTKGAVLSDVNLFAGGITWFDRAYDERTGAALRPLEMGANLQFGDEMLSQIRADISDAFYLSKLTLPQKSGQTAYETARLVEEYIRAAIPLFEPLETDYSQPVLDATFSELMGLGAFGSTDSIPDELAGSDVDFQFSNPLQETIETEKAQKASGLAQLLQIAAGIEQMQQQSAVTRNVDLNKIVRDAGMAVSPASWWLDEDKIPDAQPAPAQELAGAGAAAQNVKSIADAAQSVGQAGMTLDQAFNPAQAA